MEKTNFDFLCDDMRFTGFGEGLQRNLLKEMEAGKDPIELYFAQEMGKDAVQAVLHFTKPDPDGYYFFTKYKLCLNGNCHFFTIFKGRGITLKEAYNLLCGRPVFKQLSGRNGQLYNTWLQFDLEVREGDGYKVNKYHESHGYDLSEALGEMTVETPSTNWDFSMMLRSLERGNLQAAFLRENGENHRVLLEANPKDRNIIIHKEPGQSEMSLKTTKPAFNDAGNHSATDNVENNFGKKRSRKTAKA